MIMLMLLVQSIVGPMPEIAPRISQLEVAAVIGGLLIVARVIVMCTKTKKDDRALEKVVGWLKVIRVITGLNIQKGVDKYSKNNLKGKK